MLKESEYYINKIFNFWLHLTNKNKTDNNLKIITNPYIKNKTKNRLKFETATWKANVCFIWFSDSENKDLYIFVQLKYRIFKCCLGEENNCVQLEKEMVVQDAK